MVIAVVMYKVLSTHQPLVGHFLPFRCVLIGEHCRLPAQMSSESCANKSGLETSVVTALCTVSMPLVLNVVLGFFVVS